MESPGTMFWFEKLSLTILSYCIILVPIALIVITTKFRLCPNPLQTSLLVQWFVYGRDHKHTGTCRSSNEDGLELIQENSVDRRKATKTYPPNSNIPIFLWCFFGLQISYLTWGVLQEKIMTTQYIVAIDCQLTNCNSSSEWGNRTNEDSQHQADSVIMFRDPQFLVFVNRIAAFIVAVVALVTLGRRDNSEDGQNKNTKPQAPLYEYIYSSLSNILSSWCQYEALKYVNFPTQVLSKACKLIPVMLMSKLISRKRYSAFDYLCALMLSLGMSIFLLFQEHDKKQESNDNISTIQSATTTTGDPGIKHDQLGPSDLSYLNATYTKMFASTSSTGLSSGLAILALYLTFDSFTSNWQGKLFSRYRVTSHQMMAASNFYSILLTIISLVRLGDLEPAFRLLATSSKLFIDCVFVSITSAVGQLFVYYTIRKFGPVVFTIIMTSRQLISILLSCALYGHSLGFGSIIGLAVVFLIIFIQIGHKMRS